MDSAPIALSAGSSAFLSFIASFTLLYDWRTSRDAPRFEWGVGLFFYGLGHVIVVLMFSVIGDYDIYFFIYITFSSVIAMSLLLSGTLLLFGPNRTRIKILSSFYGLFFFVGTLFFMNVNPKYLIINPVLIGKVTNRTMTSWFIIEILIPTSFLIAVLMFSNLRQTRNIASFWISLHFFLYGILLIIWPFEELKLFFYAGRALILATILVGVREISRKKVYSQIIKDAKSESAFLLDILAHDIRNHVFGSQLLLDSDPLDEISRDMIKKNLVDITQIVDRVRRYRDIDRLEETTLSSLDLIDIIEDNIHQVIHVFPNKDIDYEITKDPEVDKFIVLGNDFLNDLFLNIFNNSVKHDSSKSKTININVTITELPIEKAWLIKIKDNGSGIPEDMIASLFSLSIDSNYSHPRGLGCLIVRKIVKWYGGRVWAENIVKDGNVDGTCINLILPMVPLNQ